MKKIFIVGLVVFILFPVFAFARYAEEGESCDPISTQETTTCNSALQLQCVRTGASGEFGEFLYQCSKKNIPAAPARTGICASCNISSQCGAKSADLKFELQCLGGSGSADANAKRTGYCQYDPRENKVALCNPLLSENFRELLNNITNFIFNVAIILMPILVVYAGFLFLTAAGNPKQVVTARNVLLWTAVGFAVILLSKGLVSVLQGILGF